MGAKFIDVCCGCGALSLGLKLAGLTPVLAIDYEQAAVEVYKANVDGNAFVGYIESLHLSKGEADILVGGLPCQGFSTIGKKDVNDRRNYLWVDFLRLMKECEPTTFLIENVQGFLKTRHFRVFLKKVKSLGYYTQFYVLNAVDYGIAQHRKRAIFSGSLNRKPETPEPSDEIKTLRDVIGDLPLEPDGKNDHSSRNFTEYSLKRYRQVPPGGDWSDLPKSFQCLCWRKLKRPNSVFGRLLWEKPSVTIRTTFLQPECGRYLHPEADRPLTVREGARIQDFPDQFSFSTVSSLRMKAKLIGNAVPVGFAKVLGKEVLLPTL